MTCFRSPVSDNNRCDTIAYRANSAVGGKCRGLGIVRQRVAGNRQVEFAKGAARLHAVNVLAYARVGDQRRAGFFKTEAGERNGRRDVGIFRIQARRFAGAQQVVIDDLAGIGLVEFRQQRRARVFIKSVTAQVSL